MGRRSALSSISPNMSLSAKDRVSWEVELVSDARSWNRFLEEAVSSHLLQSYEWGQLKSSFGWRVERLALAQGDRLMAGAQVLFHPTPLGSLAYLPRGPAIRSHSPDLVASILREVHRLAQRQGAIFLKMEPSSLEGLPLLELGFRPSNHVIQPRRSILLDLTLDLEAIMRGLKPKTRYNIRLSARKGVMVREGSLQDLPLFYQLLRETSRRDGFAIHAQPYYGQVLEQLGERAKLFLAHFQGVVLAGIIVARFGVEAIYLYGASSERHRNLMPNHLLQWEAISWAKAQGCTRYDLWGIPEPAGDAQESTSPEIPTLSRSSSFWGVYRFKQGFGGQEVRYPGAFDYIYHPWRYRLWTRLLPWIQRWRGGFRD